MSLLFADPDELRAVAGRISGHASALRASRHRLDARVARTRWSGPAAALFRAQAGYVLASVSSAAGRLDDAADALRRLADALATFLADVRAALRAAGRLGEDVLSVAGDLLLHADQLGGDLASVLGDATDLGGDLLDAGGDLVDGALGVVGL